MKSIMKWLTGIFLAFSLLLSFFTPFEKALTLNLLLFYFLSSLWILQARLKPTNGFSKSSTS